MLLYRRLASPLHATRAGVGAAWALALVAAALISEHPLLLAVLALATVLAGAAAGVAAELRRTTRLAVAMGIVIVAVNLLVNREGLTVFARLGDLGPFGQGDLTVEALVYGLVVWLKLAVVMLACALAALTVEADGLLRSLRRISFRSALTISLSVRMAGVLAGDARRLAEAQRTRPNATAGARARVALLSAVVASSLDRAMDVAATLELRGLASGHRPPPRARARLSRHDLAFGASALAAVALALAARLTGAASFTPYPTIRASIGPASVAIGGALALAVLLPFASRRGIEP